MVNERGVRRDAVEAPGSDVPEGWTLRELADRIRRKEVSATESLDASLRRIESSYDRNDVNAFLYVDRERAHADAQHLDDRLAAGRTAGELHGIPICVKDVFEVADMPFTAGGRLGSSHVPLVDARLVRRLRDAGAIVVGKTNLDEMSFGTTSVNPHFGPVRNPNDLTRISGGSSGGTAAACAAWLTPAGVGGDAGGSIRIPAALCGAVGLKPSLGGVSSEGAMETSWTMGVPGPAARNVADAAAMFSAMSAERGNDVLAHAVSGLPDDPGDLRGLRVAVPRNYFFDGNDPDVEQALNEALQRFEAHGAIVAEMSMPDAEAAVPAGLAIVLPEALTALEEYWKRVDPDFTLDGAIDKLGEGVRAIVEGEKGPDASPVPALAYLEALRTGRQRVRESMNSLLEWADVICTPTCPSVAPELTEAEEMSLNGETVSTFETLVRYTFHASVSGFPAISVPGPVKKDRLPVGIQLMTGLGRDWDLLRTARAFELAGE